MYLCLNRGTCGRGMELPAFVKLAKDAGFAGADVDLGYGVEKGAAALHDLYAGQGLNVGGWGPPEWRKEEGEWKAGLEVLAKQAKVAREVGADSCATWIMPSSEMPFHQNWHFHAQRLREVAKVLAGEGLRLGLEFVAPYHLRTMFPHEFVFTPGLMLELAAECGGAGANVGLLVDCFHLHCSGVPAAYVSKLAKEKIVLAHVNDAPKVAVHEVLDGTRVLPGEGAIDQTAFRAALSAAGYAGPVSLEVFNRFKDVSPEAAAKEAREVCRRAGW